MFFFQDGPDIIGEIKDVFMVKQRAICISHNKKWA